MQHELEHIGGEVGVDQRGARHLGGQFLAADPDVVDEDLSNRRVGGGLDEQFDDQAADHVVTASRAARPVRERPDGGESRAVVRISIVG